MDEKRSAHGNVMKLLSPVEIGDLHLRNRMVMSAMTRSRAVAGHVPSPLAPTGALILNGGYTADVAEATLRRGLADAIGFGTLFLANPDLPGRFAKSAPLNVPDRSTFYSGEEKGYTDYPAMPHPSERTVGVIGATV